MLISYKRTQTGIIVRVKIKNSATGTGLTSLTNASSGLRIGTIVDSEQVSTMYTQVGSTIDSITTIGTYSAPSSGHCRFKEVDPSNHVGVYEMQFEDSRFAVNGKYILISWTGANGMLDGDALISLTSIDPYSASFGLVGLPSVAPGTSGGLPTVNSSNQITDPAGLTTLLSRIAGAITILGGKVASTVASGDSADLTTLLARLTLQRAANLDNLDLAISSVNTSVQSITNHSARMILAFVNQMQVPTSGSRPYEVDLVLYDLNGNNEDADSLPTISAGTLLVTV
jgi:hypothetical protein